MYTFLYIYISISVCVYIYTHRYMYINVYTHTHIYTDWQRREREIYLKELAHIMKKAGKFKICKVCYQTRDQRQARTVVQDWRPLLQNFWLLSGVQSFVLFRSSADWMRFINTKAGNLLIQWFKCISHPNTFS